MDLPNAKLIAANEPSNSSYSKYGYYYAAKVLAEEIDRLQAIVDKLPVTANGVPVVPGMTLYEPLIKPCRGTIVLKEYPSADAVEKRGMVRRHGYERGWIAEASKCYSTREAANAAGGNDGT